ncbi:hypothetical protein [Dokdonella ginsengisoli]|uniref:RsbT co-antagonist protein RsbRD N-terminal domain-containing protein n=1 Tax=Dokdonella ginsengisoli TaxID=363846 RepID=A0ABV9QTD1_9GAMM
MINELMEKIYSLFLLDGEDRVPWIEEYLGGVDRPNISSDDRRNELNIYKGIFSNKNRSDFESIYLGLRRLIKGKSYDSSHDFLAAMRFLQQVVSVALWKYGLEVGATMEDFAREFDRLDVPEERIRLYESLQ